MPWYRLHITSNSGKDQVFRWVDYHLGDEDEEELKFQLDSWLDSLNAQGAFTAGYEKVDALPPDIRKEMIDSVKSRMEKDSVLLDHLRADALKNPEGIEDEDPNWVNIIRHEITQGNFAAEEADDRAARAWELIEKAQTALARFVEGVERRSALEGAKMARERAKRRKEHR